MLDMSLCVAMCVFMKTKEAQMFTALREFILTSNKREKMGTYE